MSNKQELKKIAKEIAQIKRELTASNYGDYGVGNPLINLAEKKEKVKKLVDWEVKHHIDSFEQILYNLESGYYSNRPYSISSAVKDFRVGNWHNELHEAYSQDREYNDMLDGLFEDERDGMTDYFMELVEKKTMPIYKKYFPMIAKEIKKLDPSFKYKPNFDINYY